MDADFLDKRISKKKFYILVAIGVGAGILIGLLLFAMTSGFLSGEPTHADAQSSLSNGTLTIDVENMNDANNVTLSVTNNAQKQYIDSTSSEGSFSVSLDKYPQTSNFIVSSKLDDGSQKVIAIYTINQSTEEPTVENKLRES